MGTGVYKRAGVQTFCRSFEMKFQGDKAQMRFLGGQRACDTHDESFVDVSMSFLDGKLFYGAQRVGSITGNLLQTQFSIPEGPGMIRHWRMSMRAEGNTLVYEESRTMNNETTPLISFAGILTKQQ